MWPGNPAADEKGFLAAVKGALVLHPELFIEHRLHEKLAKALSEYDSGRLSRACSLAHDETKAAEKSGDKAEIEDAKYLGARAKEAQPTWLRELGLAAARKDATAYVEIVYACNVAFARGDVQGDLDRLDKEAHEDASFEMRLSDSQEYLDLLDDRPILIPARKDAAGDRFTGLLQALARSAPNPTDETRTAKDLVDCYRLTAR